MLGLSPFLFDHVFSFQKRESKIPDNTSEFIRNKLSVYSQESTKVKNRASYAIQSQDSESVLGTDREATNKRKENIIELVSHKAVLEGLGPIFRMTPQRERTKQSRSQFRYTNQTFFVRSTSKTKRTAGNFFRSPTKQQEEPPQQLVASHSRRRTTTLRLPQQDHEDFQRFTESRSAFVLIRVERKWIFNKFSERYGSRIATLFLEFIETPTIVDFQWWYQTRGRLLELKTRAVLVFSFRLFDVNGDRFVCSGDLFKLIQEKLTCLQSDLKKIYRFARKNLNNLQKQSTDELFKLQLSKTVKQKFIRLSDVEQWNSVLEAAEVEGLGMKFSRVVPLLNYFGAQNYFCGIQEVPLVPFELPKHPPFFEDNAPFSINFSQFQRIWLTDNGRIKEEISTWVDLLQFFSGR